MPTNDPQDPPSRRRPLGRGPGAVPVAAAPTGEPDRSAGPDDERTPPEAAGSAAQAAPDAREAEARNDAAAPVPVAEPDALAPPPGVGARDAGAAADEARGAATAGAEAASGEAEAKAPGTAAVPPPGGDAATAEAHGAPPARGDAPPQRVPRGGEDALSGPATDEPRGAAAPGARQGEGAAHQPRTEPAPGDGPSEGQARPRAESAGAPYETGHGPSEAGPSAGSAGESEPAHERAQGEDGADEGAARGHGAPPDGGGAAEDGEAAGGQDAAGDGGNIFTVRLDNFEGPFDLLLQLISKHKLDVTEVALSKVTDEFMAHIRAMGPDWDLDQTTEFLVVAATLLDLKAARLLPAAEVEDEADLALLEARDLLFARLLQYRAYKEIADIFHERLVEESRRYPRTVGLEPHHAELLPDVVIRVGPEGFAKLAVKAMQAKPKPQVYVDHIHAPLVSVREQADVVVGRLRELGEASFATLTEDAPDTLTVVARFLALLELYRERAILLDQPEALGALMVRWTGAEDGQRPLVTDEFDQEARPPADTEKQEVRT
ncbi:segregation/condensation protein A [Streptomyces sp. NPDC001700]